MSLRCRLFGHSWYAVAENPGKRGDTNYYPCSCWRRRCGASAVMTVYGKESKPIQIRFFEMTKDWTVYNKGAIPQWAKIIVN